MGLALPMWLAPVSVLPDASVCVTDPCAAGSRDVVSGGNGGNNPAPGITPSVTVTIIGECDSIWRPTPYPP